jgi:hypothetical protein
MLLVKFVDHVRPTVPVNVTHTSMSSVTATLLSVIYYHFDKVDSRLTYDIVDLSDICFPNGQTDLLDRSLSGLVPDSKIIKHKP